MEKGEKVVMFLDIGGMSFTHSIQKFAALKRQKQKFQTFFVNVSKCLELSRFEMSFFTLLTCRRRQSYELRMQCCTIRQRPTQPKINATRLSPMFNLKKGLGKWQNIWQRLHHQRLNARFFRRSPLYMTIRGFTSRKTCSLRSATTQYYCMTFILEVKKGVL